MKRRRYLQHSMFSVGTIGLTGCLLAPTTQPTDSDTRGSEAVLSPTSWPMYRVGARNTGYHPGASGPKNGVAESWRFETGSNIRLHAAKDSSLYYDDIGDIYQLGIESRSQKALVTDQLHSATIAVEDGVGYVGGWGVDPHDERGRLVGRVLRIDLKSGTIAWSIVPNQRTLDTTTETTEWNSSYGSDIVQSPPTLAENAVYICSYGYDQRDNKRGTIYSLQKSDGTLIWRTEVSGWPHYAPAVADSFVYVSVSGAAGFRVVVLDTTDGSIEQELVPETGAAFTAPVTANGYVYVGSDGGIYSIKSHEWTIDWMRKTAGRTHPPAITDSTAYVTSQTELLAIDTSSGVERWQTEGTDFTDPLLVDGILYVGDGKWIRAFDAESGTERWRFETRSKLDIDVMEEGITSLLVVDKCVYAATEPGDIYALAEEG